MCLRRCEFAQHSCELGCVGDAYGDQLYCQQTGHIIIHTMSHHHAYYVTSSYIWDQLYCQQTGHIIIHTMSHHQSYYVTSSYIWGPTLLPANRGRRTIRRTLSTGAPSIIHTMSHHHTYYVTSSCILCHIIIPANRGRRTIRRTLSTGAPSPSRPISLCRGLARTRCSLAPTRAETRPFRTSMARLMLPPVPLCVCVCVCVCVCNTHTVCLCVCNTHTHFVCM